MGAINPSSDSIRRRLIDLRNGLLKLHKTLLDSERGIYEQEIQRITSANHLLSLVLHDPWFAWLHELSEFIVMIDEILAADEPATGEDSERLLTNARTLLMPAENGEGFRKHYFVAMQRDPDVVLAHREMTILIEALRGELA